MDTKPSDDLYLEVKKYRDLYRHCSSEQLLAIMGEMKDFFFNRMTLRDFQKYQTVKAHLSQRARV